MSSGLFVILPQASPKILQWRAKRKCTSSMWSMVKMFSTALEFSHIFNEEKSPSASLHYIHLNMHKSASVYGGCWSHLICGRQWKPHFTVTAFLYCDKSGSMSSWMCPLNVQNEPSTPFIGHSLAGLSDHHQMRSAKCLIAIFWAIFKSHYRKQVSVSNNLLGADQSNSVQLPQEFLLKDPNCKF